MRNLAATFGVALVVAFTTTGEPGSIDGFRKVWWLLVASGVAVSLLSTRLPRPALATTSATAAPVPVEAHA